MLSRARIAVITFIYQAENIENYALECLRSIKNQSDQSFDLFVFNDGFINSQSFVSALDFQFEVVNISGTISENRMSAIQQVTNLGYEYIIFLDIDDFSELNRVQVVMDKFSLGADIVVNELILFGHNYDESYHMLSGRLSEDQKITIEMISSGNCMGLSNTAFKTALLSKNALRQKNVVAFDWLFYSNLLLQGANAIFTAKTATYYRQHEGNVATLRPTCVNAVIDGLKVKIDHFNALNSPNALELENTMRELIKNKKLMNKYFEELKVNNKTQIFWWESYKTLEEYKL